MRTKMRYLSVVVVGAKRQERDDEKIQIKEFRFYVFICDFVMLI